MRNWTARIGIFLMLAGCGPLADQQTQGATLAELHGTLSLAEGVKPPKSELRVSVVWQDPHLAGDVPGACENAKLTGWRYETNLLEQRAQLTTDFPSGFSVSLTEPPPTAAIFDDLDGNGLSGARGDIVVYEDRNGNNRLDPRGFDSESPDLVFGWSQGTNPLNTLGNNYAVIYLSRDREPTIASLSFGDGKAGYSLETFGAGPFGSLDSRAQRLSEATVDLTLEPSAYAQQSACALRCNVSPEELSCPDDPNELINSTLGQQVSVDPAAASTAWIRQDADRTVFTTATCSVPSAGSGNGNRYTFDFSSTSVQGCTQTGTNCTYVKAAESAESAHLPCTEYHVGYSGPAEPVQPPQP
jgi:hypothetical protein